MTLTMQPKLHTYGFMTSWSYCTCHNSSNISGLLFSAGVGPVYETDDPDQFMQYMEDLMALGGGDEPEMCLSAIQVNLHAVSFIAV